MWMRLFIFILFIGIFPFLTSAQTSLSLGQQQIGVRLSPAYPEPGDEVVASIPNSPQVSAGTIRWLINNVPQTPQTNPRVITTTAGDLGERTTITAQIIQNNVIIAEYSNTIDPVRVDIIFEPLTYVPRFYQGSALPTVGGKTKVRALVFLSNTTDPNSLIYRWLVNEFVVAGGPLLGNSTIEVPVPRRPGSNLLLEVMDESGQMIIQKNVPFPVTEPKLLFYPVSPLLGRSAQAIKDRLIVSGQEETVRAIPYHISLEAIANDPLIEWESGGRRIDSSDSLDVVVATPNNDIQHVYLRMHDLNNFSQGVQGSFQVSN